MDAWSWQTMNKYLCKNRGYVCGPEKKDPDSGPGPGTTFADPPKSRVSPAWGIPKDGSGEVRY